MSWVLVTFMFLFVLVPFLPLAFSLLYTWFTAPEATPAEE